MKTACSQNWEAENQVCPRYLTGCQASFPSWQRQGVGVFFCFFFVKTP